MKLIVPPDMTLKDAQSRIDKQLKAAENIKNDDQRRGRAKEFLTFCSKNIIATGPGILIEFDWNEPKESRVKRERIKRKSSFLLEV